MTTQANGNGRGSVYKRASDKKWVASVSYTDITGSTRRRVKYASTKRAALDNLDEMRRRIADGQTPVDATMTVGVWLERWQSTSVAGSDRKATTIELYRKVVDRWIAPAIGEIRLDRLRPSDIESMLLKMRARKLSGQSRRLAYNVTRSALAGAVRDGLLRTNPAASVARPAPGTKEAQALMPEQVSAVIQATADERLGPLVVVLAYTGLRIGEALALRWAEINIEASTLRVSATLARVGGAWVRTEPKSARSRRTIPLTQPVLDALNNRHQTQELERLAMGRAWRETDLVFATEDGGPLDHRNVLRWYQRLAGRAGVTGGFHTLRHSAATSLMIAGVPLRVVADVLGHSSTRLTADTYSHVSETLSEEALARLEGLY